MVRAPRRFVHPAAADALRQHRVGHLERDHDAHALARRREHRVEAPRLLDGAREAVEQEAARAVRLHDAVLDHADHEVVRHEPARLHHLLGCLPDLGARGDGRAQHVARAQLRHAERADDERRLRALARAPGGPNR